MNDLSTNEFMQDFFEEAGEHLTLISQNLLRLEQADEIEQHELLQDLFRSFHTLKGLCGMMNLAEGARLSHVMETIIRSAQQRVLRIDDLMIDLLLQSARSLSDMVNALQNPGSPMPEFTFLLARADQLLHLSSSIDTESNRTTGVNNPDALLETQLRSGSAAGLPELGDFPELQAALSDLDRQNIAAARQAGRKLWVITFLPSQARAERGENVDLLREQIQQQATLLKSVPAMQDGRILFRFLVAADHSPASGDTIADEITQLVEKSTVQQPKAGSYNPVSLPSTTIRVELSRLDDLMRTTADLVKLRARLSQVLSTFNGSSLSSRRELQLIHQQFGRELRDLRQLILRARLVPLSEAFNHMPLVVRDLSREIQKEVRLEIIGETSEVDKALVERLIDPLMHLMRNAITHGIEPPSERTASGKTRYGKITLRGVQQAEHILVEVSDDGRGIDFEQVAQKAAGLGLLPEGQAVTNQEVLHILTQPGFSTREQADFAAGRGVGLDIVQKMVRAFGGQLRLFTVPGHGSTFSMLLPLTLTIMDVLFVQSAGQRYAVPQDAVDRIIDVNLGEIIRAEAGEILPAGEDYYVVHHLTDFIQSQNQRGINQLFGLISREEQQSQPAGRPLLLVESVQTIQEVVVHPLVDPYLSQPGLRGATELGDSSVVLILDLPAVFETLANRSRWRKSAEAK